MADKYKPIEEMTEAEFVQALADPMFRLQNLYWIKTKDDDDDSGDGLVVKFKPNPYQLRFLSRMHTRNLILKARQLGFSTLIQIFFLDCALFSPNINCGVIAHTDDAAKKLFKKIKFAYDRLPEMLKQAVPQVTCNASEMVLANGSTITVSTSMRGDTLQYLHVSEFGKICAKFPHRAQEVITGTIPSVPAGGIIVIESTAEGRDGAFYRMCIRALALLAEAKKLTNKEYRIHFFPWHEADEYAMPADGVIISPKDHEYFDQIEAKTGKKISIEKRAWWVSTRDNDFSGEDSQMWQEYPSTPEESFRQSTEGCYFTKQLATARKNGQFKPFIPIAPGVPCFTFWDIGNSDGTAIWVLQRIGNEWRCVRFYEAWGEPYSHAAIWLQGLGLIWDTMYLPHDADHVRQGQLSNKSPKQMLEELMPSVRWETVPRVDNVNWGIQQTRDVFPLLYFDETECKEGIAHIESYKKKWNSNQERWSDEPDKSGGHSESADALRQFGQAYAGNLINISRGKSVSSVRRNKSWRTS